MTKINGSTSKNGYGFYAVLTETLGNNYLNTNVTTVNYEVYIVNGNKRTDSNGWTFNAKIDGSDVYNRTNQNLKTNDTDYNEAKLLFSGTKDIKHNTDGTKTITFSSTLSKSSYGSYDPGKCSLSGTFKLTDIPRASTLTTTSTYVSFGDSVRIDIKRNVSNYTDTITWVGYYPVDNGDGSFNLQGTPSDVKGTIVEKTNEGYIDWQIPDELSTLIPTLRFVGVKLTCTTYNGDNIIGTTEVWIYARTLEDFAKPLITYNYKETVEKIIEQLGIDNFSVPVLNVSQPEFTFSATGRYNSTIKSLKIVCDDGQESSESPYTFKPIGSAKFTILATDSRDYQTTIPVDLSANAIPYIVPTIKILEVARLSPISGKIIINASGSWYGGTMIDDVENPLNISYKCKIRDSDDEPTLVDIPSSAIVLDEQKNEWYINNYNLGNITEYNKNYDFTLFVNDYYYNEIKLSRLIRKGVSTYDYGEHDLKVNGDLYLADKDGLNKMKLNVSGKVSKNLFNKNNVILGYRLNTSGENYSDDYTNDCFVSEYIKVLPNKTYCHNNSPSYLTRLYLYDENLNGISYVENTNIITTTENTVYLRTCGTVDMLDTTQVEQNSIQTEFEEFLEPTISMNGIYNEFLPSKINLTFNHDYVYTTDLQYDCFKIGKMVFFNIHTIAFSQAITAGTVFVYGLPKPNTEIIFSLLGHRGAEGDSLRCAISPDTGNIRTHYDAPSYIGDSSNNQYNGVLIYEAKI